MLYSDVHNGPGRTVRWTIALFLFRLVVVHWSVGSSGMKGNLMGKSKSGHSRVTWTKSSSCIPLVTSFKTESNRFCRVFNMSGTLWTFNSLN